jgi:hypothetical protein
MHNLPNSILNHNRLALLRREPALADKHTVLEFLIVLVAGLLFKLINAPSSFLPILDG